MNPFEFAGTTVSNKALITVEWPYEGKGKYGTIEILCGNIKFDTQNSERMYLQLLEGGLTYYGAMEGKNWSEQFRNTEPFNRSIATYIPFSFKQITIVLVTDTRFLSLTKTWETQLGTSIDEVDTCQNILVEFGTEEMYSALYDMLPNIGVAQQDLVKVINTIFSAF